MKFKSIFALSLAALALGACSSDDALFDTGIAGADTGVTFTIDIPATPASRAINEGEKATRITAIVFDKTGNYLFQKTYDGVFTSGSTVKVDLLQGESYTVAFWVDAPGSPYTIGTDGTVTVDYDAANANDDARDAFYAARSITVSANSLNQSITLTRPFAQVNLGTSDYAVVTETYGKTFTQTEVTISGCAYAKMNLADGNVLGEPVDVTFSMAQMPDFSTAPVTLTAGGEAYSWIGMNYVLCDAGGGTISNITFSTDNADLGSRSYTSGVPVKRNFRSNLVGSLFTSPTGWTVIVDTDMPNPDVPLTANASGVYEIATPADMYSIAKTIATANRPGDTRIQFALTADIDMAGYIWTPIGVNMIALNGNNHTIKNLTTTKDNWRGGLFGYGGCYELYDITLENFNVYGAQAGIISGNFDGGAYVNLHNITIKGHNTVNYVPYSSPSYTETYPAVGALFGVVSWNCTGFGITIDENCVIDINTNGMNTLLTQKQEDYCYLNGVDPVQTITNNGTINVWYKTGITANADGSYNIVNGQGLATAAAELMPNGGTYVIANDINMTGIRYTPPFFPGKKVIIKGNNHVISGLNVKAYSAALLAGNTSGDSGGSFDISDLTIANSTFTGLLGDDTGSAAAFSGYMSGTSTIQNCKAINNTYSGAKYLGGIVSATASTLSISDCLVQGCTFVCDYREEKDGEMLAKGHVGGIIGYNNCKNVTRCGVEDCTFDFQGYGLFPDKPYRGQFVGYDFTNTYTYIDCWVKGNTGLAPIVGGPGTYIGITVK